MMDGVRLGYSSKCNDATDVYGINWYEAGFDGLMGF